MDNQENTTQESYFPAGEKRPETAIPPLPASLEPRPLRQENDTERPRKVPGARLSAALAAVNIILTLGLIAALAFVLRAGMTLGESSVSELKGTQKDILETVDAIKERSALTTLETIYSYIDGLGRVPYDEEARVYISDSTYGETWLPLLKNVPKSTFEADKFSFDDNGFMTYTGTDATAVQGIDVSSFQGDIDWRQVADAGIKFVYVRAGYRGYGESGKLMPDDYFLQNVRGASEAGLDVGAYFFSQATGVEEGVEEAWYLLDLCADVKELITLELIFDWEPIFGVAARTDGVSVRELNQAAAAFCGILENEGYKTGLYFNLRLAVLKYDLADFADKSYWYAQYNPTPDFPYQMKCWQYSSTGKVNGITGDVDMDVMLVK